MYSYLIDDNSEHEKAKGVNRNTVATTNHNEYKDVFLNQKCLRNSMNRFQSKDHEMGMRWISSWLLELIIKKSYLNNYSGKFFFFQSNCFNFQSNQDSSFVKHIVLIFSLDSFFDLAYLI